MGLYGNPSIDFATDRFSRIDSFEPRGNDDRRVSDYAEEVESDI
jgi:hypothetical protein